MRELRLLATPAGAGEGASCEACWPAPSLIVSSDNGAERYSVALRGDRVTIGCDPADTIFLADLTISPRHATLRRTVRGYALDQAASRGETGVGRLAGCRRLLADGDRLKIGRYRITYRVGGVRHV